MIRRKTRVVWVNKVPVGGEHPIRIQSMTTTPTHEVEATTQQIVELADAGCEIARVTVQGKKEARACEKIKNGLLQRGYSIPLVADIHFYPPAALSVAPFVDKVRINPGNFADPRAQFKRKVYDEAAYSQELERIEEKFAPLVELCRDQKKAMRIGVNHGSLSDRILNHFGDSPAGMVESAFEYTRICRKMGYHNLIFSMKSSNPKVMIEAYRLLCLKMDELGWDYPLHLGVTEAGEGVEGRVKSTLGIGTLLLDGMGDTIRMSLTEEAVHEVPACRQLLACLEKKPKVYAPEIPEDHRREISMALNVDPIKEDLFSSLGYLVQLGRPEKKLDSVDIVLSSEQEDKLTLLEKAGAKRKLEGELFDPRKLTLKEARKRCVDGKKRVLHLRYKTLPDSLPIQVALDAGAYLLEGLVSTLYIEAPVETSSLRNLSLVLLQAARKRFSKTEFISCPGCGRTLFDLQTTSQKIREKTEHLPGVKIAIMGCIVNGPGEMADADFGYVGSRPGKIDLYVGKERVERDIPQEIAVERLIALINAHGKWIDPCPKKERDETDS